MSEEISKGKKLILQEAGRLFIQNGYFEVSIRDIAKACDMTNAAIYYHFEDKEALFFEVIDYLMSELRGYFTEISKMDLIAKEKIKKMLMVFLNFSMNAETSFTRVMHDLRVLMKEKHGKDQGFVHSATLGKVFEAMDLCFEEAESKGEITSLQPPFKHSSLLMSLNRGMVTNLIHESDYLSNNDISIENLADMVINIYWHGVEVK